MKLSLWFYTHRFGVDIVIVTHDRAATPSKEEVIKASEIDWQGEGSVNPREDEFLEHFDDIDLERPCVYPNIE